MELDPRTLPILAGGLHLDWTWGERAPAPAGMARLARLSPLFHFVAVHSGYMDCRWGKESLRVDPGAGILMPPHVRHDFVFTKASWITWADFAITYAVSIDAAGFFDFPMRLSQESTALLSARAEHITATRTKAAEPIKQLLALLESEHQFLMAVLSLARLCPVDERLSAFERLSALIATIHAQPGQHWNRKRMCELTGLSPNVLTNLFREAARMPPAQFVAQMRLRLSQEQLLSTDRSLAEIARALGFVDAFHFSKRFKQSYGLSPSAYRRHYPVLANLGNKS